jgi:hypothetical protein
MPLHHGVCIGKSVGKEDFVLTELELVLETQTVVGLPNAKKW